MQGKCGNSANVLNTQRIDMDEDTDVTKILVGIGRLEAKADATNEHLAQLNGSVRTLYGKAETNRIGIETAERALLQHQIDCPGLKTIMEIDRKLVSGDFAGSKDVRAKLLETEKKEAERQGKEKTTDKWKEEFVIPIVKWLLMALFILFLLHANDLLKAGKP